jgi:hypothetical protein
MRFEPDNEICTGFWSIRITLRQVCGTFGFDCGKRRPFFIKQELDTRLRSDTPGRNVRLFHTGFLGYISNNQKNPDEVLIKDSNETLANQEVH